MDWLKTGVKKLVSTPSIPNFLIIGAQKAGTSSLHSYLNYHPKLKGVYPKELHFFDHIEQYEIGLEEYKEHFLRPFWDRRLYYESTPNYLYHPESAEVIRFLNPKMKFIVLLREPLDRAYSAWNMFKNNYEKLKSEGKEIPDYYQVYAEKGAFLPFEEVVKRELEIIRSGEKDFKETYSLLRKGLYQGQLDTWFSIFPKEQFYIQDFEKFISEPLSVLNEISEFLGVTNFDDLELDLRPRNKREYEMQIDPKVRQEIEEFYQNA